MQPLFTGVISRRSRPPCAVSGDFRLWAAVSEVLIAAALLLQYHFCVLPGFVRTACFPRKKKKKASRAMKCLSLQTLVRTQRSPLETVLAREILGLQCHLMNKHRSESTRLLSCAGKSGEGGCEGFVRALHSSLMPFVPLPVLQKLLIRSLQPSH